MFAFHCRIFDVGVVQMCLFRGLLTDFKLKRTAKNPTGHAQKFVQTRRTLQIKGEKFYDGGAARFGCRAEWHIATTIRASRVITT